MKKTLITVIAVVAVAFLTVHALEAPDARPQCRGVLDLYHPNLPLQRVEVLG